MFDDPQANTNSWVTYHDTNMHVMFSRDVQNLPRFSTPWARHPHGGVLFDVCTDERHPFEREGGGKRAAMRSTCGIPADTSPLCSSGAGWASAFSGSGNAEYCSWLDARFHGVAAADRQPKERCYDVNDECLSEGPIPRTRPVNAASVVFDEVEHDANQYKSVRLPRGVTLRVKFRASGASLAQGEMRSIARIDNVAPPAFPEGLAPPDGGPGWSKVGGSVQRDDVMFSWSPFLGENDFKFLRSYALGDGSSWFDGLQWKEFQSYSCPSPRYRTSIRDETGAFTGEYIESYVDGCSKISSITDKHGFLTLGEKSLYSSNLLQSFRGAWDGVDDPTASDKPQPGVLSLLNSGDGRASASHVPRVLSDAYEQNPRLARGRTTPGSSAAHRGGTRGRSAPGPSSSATAAARSCRRRWRARSSSSRSPSRSTGAFSK